MTCPTGKSTCPGQPDGTFFEPCKMTSCVNLRLMQSLNIVSSLPRSCSVSHHARMAESETTLCPDRLETSTFTHTHPLGHFELLKTGFFKFLPCRTKKLFKCPALVLNLMIKMPLPNPTLWKDQIDWHIIFS